MAAFPYLPFYPADFFADTVDLSQSEEGCYFRLLCFAWLQSDCGLPDDDKTLAKLAKASKGGWPRQRARVLERYFVLREGRWFSPRLEKEREKVARRSTTNSQNGSLGGRPKSLKSNDTTKANGFSGETETKAFQNQNQNQNYKREKATRTRAQRAPADAGAMARSAQYVRELRLSDPKLWEPANELGMTNAQYLTEYDAFRLYYREPKRLIDDSTFPAIWRDWLARAAKRREQETNTDERRTADDLGEVGRAAGNGAVSYH